MLPALEASGSFPPMQRPGRPGRSFSCQPGSGCTGLMFILFLLCFHHTPPCSRTHSGLKHLNLVFDEFQCLLQFTFPILSFIYLPYEPSNPEEAGLLSQRRMLGVLSWTFAPTRSPCWRWVSFSFPQMRSGRLPLLCILKDLQIVPILVAIPNSNNIPSFSFLWALIIPYYSYCLLRQLLVCLSTCPFN